MKAVVLSIEKRRISLGLKPSYFTDEDYESREDEGSESDEPDSFGVIDADEEMADADADELDGDEDEDEDEDEAMQIDLDTQTSGNSAQTSRSTSGPSLPVHASSLKLEGGFQWFGTDVQPDEDPDSDSSADESDEQSGKKKKRKRKEIEQDLTADMHTKTPESNADFERLLLGSPNSSYLWIQYMSFQLQLSEVDKAREIARRALQTINFREEQEKLNVWIALLNLENVYGTDETLEATFKDAARHNDSKTIHLRLAFIFDQAEKHQVCGLR